MGVCVCLDLIKLTGFTHTKVLRILRLLELSLIGIECLQHLSIFFSFYIDFEYIYSKPIENGKSVWYGMVSDTISIHICCLSG